MPILKNGKPIKDTYQVICDKCGKKSRIGNSPVCSFDDDGLTIIVPAFKGKSEKFYCPGCGIHEMQEYMHEQIARAMPDFGGRFVPVGQIMKGGEVVYLGEGAASDHNKKLVEELLQEKDDGIPDRADSKKNSGNRSKTPKHGKGGSPGA